MERIVPPLPTQDGPKVQHLLKARKSATDALAAAEIAEQEARRLRKIAKNRIRSYEKLVEEFNGQLKLPGT